MPILQTGLATPSASSYEIEQSIRFNDDDSAYLSRTAGTATSNRIGTISFWTKRGLISGGKALFSNHADSSNRTYIVFDANKLMMYGKISGSGNVELVTEQVFRDPSAWYHFVIHVDVTQSTASNRVKIYVNGSQITDFSTETYPAQDVDLPLFSKTNTYVGVQYSDSLGDYYDGLLAEYHYVDGSIVPVATLGETSSSTGQWIPKDTTGAITYGNNGFYLKGADGALATSITDSAKSALDTSDRSSSVTVSSSFSWEFTSSGDTTGGFLVNGDLTQDDTNGWQPSGSVSGRTVKFDFGTAKTYTKAQYVSRNSSAYDGVWKWQGSNNDSDWTDIGSSFDLGANDSGSDINYYDLTELSGNTTAYRYYRILGVSGTANTSGRRLAMYFGGGNSGVGHTVTVNGDAKHDRGSSIAVTANGDVHTDTGEKKFGTASAQFDGTGDYLSLAGDSQFDFGTGAFTIEAWVRPTNNTDWMAFFSSNNYYTNGYDGNWVIDMYDGNIRINGYDGTGSIGNVDATTSLTAGAWQHLAICRDSSGTTRIFKDGTLISAASTNLNGDTLEDGSNGIWIGKTTSAGGPGNFNGYMDDIRISAGAKYTANFSAPSSALTKENDTVLLLNCNGDNGGTTFENSADGLRIDNSRIKFDGSGDYLTVPDSDDWDFGTGDFTVEHWFRPRSIPSSDTHTTIFSGTSWPPGFRFYYADDAVPYFRVEGSAYEFTGVTLSANAWYHMAASREGTNLRLFIDGDLKATHTDSTNINSSGVLYIARRGDTTSDDANVYLDEIRISDTARYTSSFTPSTTAFTSDANTKLLIHSNWGGGLGLDSSGQSNNFSTTGLTANDKVLDAPGRNFATFFPTGVDPDSDKALSEGNLKVTFDSGSSGTAHSTIAINNDNKWYAEFLVLGTPSSGEPVIGIDNNIGWSSGIGYNASTTNDSIGYVATDGKIYKGGTLVDTESSFTANDIIQVAFDGSTGRIYFGKNNTWQNSGDPANGTGYVTTAALESDYIGFACGGHSTGSQAVVANFGQDSSFANNKTSGAAGSDFYYAPPSGFKALKASNLSPTISDPTAHFNSVLYTGTGGTRSVTGVNFSPDLTWIKSRSNAYQHMLFDSVRGATKYLVSDATDAEATDATQLTSFDSDGFSLGSGSVVNGTSATFVGWNWKCADSFDPTSGATVTTATGKRNVDAGMAIIAWTGTGSDVTISHGLGRAPGMVITKSRDDAYNWSVQSILYNSTSDTNMLYLNSTAAAADDTNVFSAAPTSSVISPQGGAWSGIGASGVKYISYVFAEISGYSAIGTYTANNSSDGPMIYTNGMSPAFFMVKKYQTVGGDNWAIYDNARDPYNVMSKQLYPDGSSSEESSSARNIDFLSNGIKIRGANSRINDGSHSFLYIAFAESPFAYSTAR